MKQITDEYRQDPTKAIGLEEIAVPVIPASFKPVHDRWVNNTSVSRQHAFCAKLCLNFKVATMDSSESNCMDSCFSKYAAAFDALIVEKNRFAA